MNRRERWLLQMLSDSDGVPYKRTSNIASEDLVARWLKEPDLTKYSEGEMEKLYAFFDWVAAEAAMKAMRETSDMLFSYKAGVTPLSMLYFASGRIQFGVALNPSTRKLFNWNGPLNKHGHPVDEYGNRIDPEGKVI